MLFDEQAIQFDANPVVENTAGGGRVIMKTPVHLAIHLHQSDMLMTMTVQFPPLMNLQEKFLWDAFASVRGEEAVTLLQARAGERSPALRLFFTNIGPPTSLPKYFQVL